MDHWQRTFAYLTESILIGLALVLFTHSFYYFANVPGPPAYITLIAFGLIFLNLNFLINRRFTLKANRSIFLSLFFAFLMAAPTLLWIFTKEDSGIGSAKLAFGLTVLFAALAGAALGVLRGRAKRADYLRKHYEEQEEHLPEELKRPHDRLSKN